MNSEKLKRNSAGFVKKLRARDRTKRGEPACYKCPPPVRQCGSVQGLVTYQPNRETFDLKVVIRRDNDGAEVWVFRQQFDAV